MCVFYLIFSAVVTLNKIDISSTPVSMSLVFEVSPQIRFTNFNVSVFPQSEFVRPTATVHVPYISGQTVSAEKHPIRLVFIKVLLIEEDFSAPASLLKLLMLSALQVYNASFNNILTPSATYRLRVDAFSDSLPRRYNFYHRTSKKSFCLICLHKCNAYSQLEG